MIERRKNAHFDTCPDHTGNCQVTYQVGEYVYGREILAIHYQTTTTTDYAGARRWDGVAFLMDGPMGEYVTALVTPYGELHSMTFTPSAPKAEEHYVTRVAALISMKP